uniref:Uncharacterized protein n=1 Tax=Aegilops tauschii subsp. strangulata TaxID=200361 RepID=A0A453LF49_AEGTS
CLQTYSSRLGNVTFFTVLCNCVIRGSGWIGRTSSASLPCLLTSICFVCRVKGVCGHLPLLRLDSGTPE